MMRVATGGGWWGALLMGTVAASGCGSGPCGVRASHDHPCEDPGLCDAVIGYAYNGSECRAVSGCGCDACCREHIAPFATEAACQQECE
jgi:hypothetical protein